MRFKSGFTTSINRIAKARIRVGFNKKESFELGKHFIKNQKKLNHITPQIRILK